MSVTATMYGQLAARIFNKEIDFEADSIKVMLCTSGYTPSKISQYKSGVTHEVAGTGYTERGQSLSSKTVTYNSDTNTVTFDAADVSWANSSITARYAVIYDDTGQDITSPLIAYIDFGQDITSSAGSFIITWSSSGIFSVTTP